MFAKIRIKHLLYLLIGTGLVLFVASCGRLDPQKEAQLLTSKISTHAIIIPVTISNKTYHFLLDTGASYTVIDNHLAKTLTQKATETQISAVVHDMVNKGLKSVDSRLQKNELTFWQPRPIVIGDYVIPESDPWLGLDLDAPSQAVGVKIDGLIGAEIFRQLNWAVDNRSNSLTVWRHAPSTLGYQQCIPYRDQYGSSPELQMDYKSHAIFLNVDTGADISYMSDEFMKFLKGEDQENVTPDIKSGRQISATGLYDGDDYFINGLYFNDMSVGRMKVGENKQGMYGIGMNFLSRFDNYLFIPSKMLFCYNASNFTRHDKESLRKISVRYFAQHVEVFYNKSEDIARFGLMNGDVLLTVNGQKITPAKIDDLRQLLSYTPSGALTLILERNGKQQMIKF
ncbi:aspartyl protease family protein [Collimonas humicola]|uniref:aspartyl protease family protein n=1 Tax=Collimonas humicola TaxID=2825886 RepID=UPI001B8BA557|nr:aspartyl protease family protein [Collimonas humicola]